MFALGVVLVELLCPFTTRSERAAVLPAVRAAVAHHPPPPPALASPRLLPSLARPASDPHPRTPAWEPAGLPEPVQAAARRFPEDAGLALRLLSPLSGSRPSAAEVVESVGRWLGAAEAGEGSEVARLRREVELLTRRLAARPPDLRTVAEEPPLTRRGPGTTPGDADPRAVAEEPRTRDAQ
jgi:hypothetical protein